VKTEGYSFLETKNKIEHYCAYQERCHQEVVSKLYNLGADSEDRERLIGHLISNNFLNEERFAEAYATGKFRLKKWGINKIKMYLKQKGVSDYSIKKGIKEIDQDEYLTTLEHLAEKKHSESTGNQWEKLAKTQRFLFNKGYESDLIFDVLKKYS
jgi:regulatory protein